MFTLIVVFYLNVLGKEMVIDKELGSFKDQIACEQVASDLTSYSWEHDKNGTTFYCQGSEIMNITTSGTITIKPWGYLGDNMPIYGR